ncbi:Ig-like domain-containing protein [Exiguobacterium mexicanum]|uniref:Ig-like domain-containing protein n=1 Tax=Exiguobacterium mexicanum TaxID=340146 RepID=UPI00110F6450|nr:Ig-like domain-containing protein [Exiguobacterium mexicanum]
MRIMKSKIAMLTFIMCLVIGTFSFYPMGESVHGATTYNIDPFSKDSKVITGQAEPNTQVQLNVDGQLVNLQTNTTGQFTYTLTNKMTSSEIHLYQITKEGYAEWKWTAYASEDLSTNVHPAQYLGIYNNEMKFSARDDHTIVAIYDGRSYSGINKLSIPLKAAQEVKFYSQYNGNRSTTTTVQNVNDKPSYLFQSNLFDYGSGYITGKTVPYLKLKFVTGAGMEYEFTADEDGDFHNYVPLQEKEVLDGFNYKIVEPTTNTELVGPTMVKPFQASAVIPFYSLSEFNIYDLTGYTFPDAVVKVDGKVIATSDSMGRISNYVEIGKSPFRLIEVIRNGEVVAKFEREMAFDVNQFKFEVVNPVTSEQSKLVAKTYPNKDFVIKYQNQHYGELHSTSDTQGDLQIELPKFHSGSYDVYVVQQTGDWQLIKSIEIEDKRLLPSPIIKTIDNSLSISSDFSTTSQLYVEAQIEKKNGEIEVYNEPIGPEGKQVDKLQTGDKYKVRVYVDENRESKFVEGIFNPISQPTFENFIEGEQTIKGKTEPNATVKIHESQYNLNDFNLPVQQLTADSNGNFTFAKKSKLDLPITISVERDNQSDRANFVITPQDITSPVFTIYRELIIPEEYPEISVKSDDALKKLSVSYYSKSKLLKTKIVDIDSKKSWKGQRFVVLFDDEGNKTLKELGIDKIVIEGENVAGLVAEPTTFIVKDTTPPNPRGINPILYGDQFIAGKTEPFTKIQIGSGHLAKLTTANAEGYFKIGLDYPFSVHSSSIRLIMTDLAGNKVQEYIRAMDHRVGDIRVNQDGSKIWFANENRKLSYQHYQIYLNGQKWTGNENRYNPYTSLIQTNRKVSFPLDVKLIMKNPDGTTKYEFSKRLTGPSKVIAPNKLESSNNRKSLTGYADKFITIDVYDTVGKKVGTNRADKDGKFAVVLYRYPVANETLKVVAKDAFGGTKTSTLKVKDRVAPTKPTVSTLTNKSTYVSGKAEKGATVYITYNGRTYTTKASSGGSYRYNVKTTKPGATVSVRAKDAAGNMSSTASRKVLNTFRTFSVNSVKSTSNIITGKGNKGATVKAYVGTRLISKTAKVDSKGNYRLTISRQKPGVTVTVKMTQSGYQELKKTTRVVK